MSGETWAIFDTETTGLLANDLRPLSRQPKAIEVAAVLVRQVAPGEWREIDAFETLLNPGVLIDAVITRVTGLRNADLEGQPRWEGVAAKFQAFIDRADGIAGHNISFDRRIIAMENARIERVTIWPEKVLCTVEVGEALWGKRVKLSDMHTNLFGSPHEGAHRAISDVRATAKCLAELMNRGEC